MSNLTDVARRRAASAQVVSILAALERAGLSADHFLLLHHLVETSAAAYLRSAAFKQDGAGAIPEYVYTPVPLLRLSRAAGIPNETARRRMLELSDRGLALKASGGWVPASSAEAEARLGPLYADLQALFEPTAATRLAA